MTRRPRKKPIVKIKVVPWGDGRWGVVGTLDDARSHIAYPVGSLDAAKSHAEKLSARSAKGETPND